MNSVNILGRCGGEVDLRYTPAGKAVANLTLAVDDGWGEHKKTCWVGVTLWGATAELAAKAVRKGDRLGITGRLSQEEWEDKEGKKQRKTKVTCDSMHLCSPKRDGQDAPDSSPPPSQQQPQAARQRQMPLGMPPAPPADDHDEDDIPF